jgi:hypothetical protein
MLFPHIALQNTVSSNVDSVRSSKQIGLYQQTIHIGRVPIPLKRFPPRVVRGVGGRSNTRFEILEMLLHPIRNSMSTILHLCKNLLQFLPISLPRTTRSVIHSSKTQVDTTTDPVTSTPSKTQTKYVYSAPDASRNQDTYIYNQLSDLSRDGGYVGTTETLTM